MVTDSKTSVWIIKKMFFILVQSLCAVVIYAGTHNIFCSLSSARVCVCVCMLSEENQTCSGHICTLDEARFVQAHLMTPVLPQC